MKSERRNDFDAWSVLIVGVGNPDRGDDALGRAAADRLAALDLPRTRVCSRSGDILTLIEDWRGAETVILIDAAAPDRQQAGAAPGSIHRLDVSGQSLPQELAGLSTHGFGLGETVELARALGVLPARTIVYVMVGQRFDAGAPLSTPVATALDDLVACVAAEVTRTAN
jgi:hydrogenase maturation protease